MLVISREYEIMLNRLKRLATDSSPYGSRVNAEQEYARAYDAMVRRGEAPKLRAKYRQNGT